MAGKINILFRVIPHVLKQSNSFCMSFNLRLYGRDVATNMHVALNLCFGWMYSIHINRIPVSCIFAAAIILFGTTGCTAEWVRI